jgi:hypothetical protein
MKRWRWDSGHVRWSDLIATWECDQAFLDLLKPLRDEPAAKPRNPAIDEIQRRNHRRVQWSRATPAINLVIPLTLLPFESCNLESLQPYDGEQDVSERRRTSGSWEKWTSAGRREKISGSVVDEVEGRSATPDL